MKNYFLVGSMLSLFISTSSFAIHQNSMIINHKEVMPANMELMIKPTSSIYNQKLMNKILKKDDKSNLDEIQAYLRMDVATGKVRESINVYGNSYVVIKNDSYKDEFYTIYTVVCPQSDVLDREDLCAKVTDQVLVTAGDTYQLSRKIRAQVRFDYPVRAYNYMYTNVSKGNTVYQTVTSSYVEAKE